MYNTPVKRLDTLRHIYACYNENTTSLQVWNILLRRFELCIRTRELHENGKTLGIILGVNIVGNIYKYFIILHCSRRAQAVWIYKYSTFEYLETFVFFLESQ